jgi:5'-nucleotidase/UDP-sugar diphosphatase
MYIKCSINLVLLLLGLTIISYGSLQDNPETLRFTILHTNDEHAALVPSPQSEYGYEGAQTRGGIARVASLIHRIRNQKKQVDEEVLVVSGGDYISGSPFSWLALKSEAPELSLLLESGYDVLTLGNHEFDYGPELLSDYLRAAGYPERSQHTPIVASNTIIPENHPLNALGIQKSYVKTLENGLKIGFLGIMGARAAGVAPMAEPVTFSDQIVAARLTVEHLISRDVDIIVMLSHSGENEDAELALAVPEIDIIIGGHTHSVIPKPIVVGKTIIVQTGTEFEYVGMLELAFDKRSKSLTMLNKPEADSEESYLIPITSEIPEDPKIKAMVDDYGLKLSALISEMTFGQVTEYNQIIAKSDVSLVRTPMLAETPLGNFVADAMLVAAERATSSRVDFVFQASGVIRGDLIPGTHPESDGSVTFYDLVSLIGLGSGPDMMPGYPMVSLYFTGEEVRRIVEISILLSELMGSTYFLQNARLLVDYDPARAVYFNIPFQGTPIPSASSILNISMYTGEGRQTENPGDYVNLKKGDQTLYHVVTDYYNASFLPMVGEILPNLKLVMKDEIGNPVELKDRIIYYNGGESKVWEAVVAYMMQQPINDEGISVLDASYARTEGRMNKVKGTHILLWPSIFALVLFIGFIIGFRYWRLRKKSGSIVKA